MVPSAAAARPPADRDRTQTADTGSDPLADRYGRRSRPTRRRRRGLIIALIVFLLVSLGWAGWVAIDQAQAPVTWQNGPFQAVDDGHARFTFTVTTDPGNRLVCTVRVFNRGLTEVGRMDVDAGPSQQRTFDVTASVPTFELASSATVRACALR